MGFNFPLPATSSEMQFQVSSDDNKVQLNYSTEKFDVHIQKYSCLQGSNRTVKLLRV